MTEYTPKAGDVVRIVLEGTVDELRSGFDFANFLSVSASSVGNLLDPSTARVISVEKLAAAEPAWWPPKPGDVARYFNSTYLRGAHDWTNMSGARIPDVEMLSGDEDGEGPATLLVRDGKPVTE